MQNTYWKILNTPDEDVLELQKALGIHVSLCKILKQRGIQNFDHAKSFFRPALQMLHDPFLLKDMEKAVARIQKAITNSEKILVFGDYDVDGTTAVAVVYSFLKDIYDENLIDFYIPDRYKEGYGVSKIGIDFAAENKFSLIICLDCGIKSVELITYANTLSVDFIICDHHLPGERLPPAIAILNAKQPDCSYPFKELCGCGVAYKLISALAVKLHIQDDVVQKYLGLVATAIAADIVSMSGENRVLAYYGLKQINEKPLPGIAALIALAKAEMPLTITNVVFILAPRINAAGRMDTGRKAVELFIESKEEKALVLAEMLHIDNTERKETDRSITAEALEILAADAETDQKRTSVLFRHHWHKGVVGIVASRVIENYYKPTIVLTLSGGLATGSARSVNGFNLYEAIYECREFLISFGGHFAAAGLSMLPENVEPFTRKFEAVVSRTILESSLIPELVIDAEISFSALTDNFYNIICQMEPFGPDNLRPVFITRGVRDNGFSKIVKEEHIRFVVQEGGKTFSGIGFRMAEKFFVTEKKQAFDIVYSLEENIWNGTKSLQLKVIDIRPSGD